MALGAITSTYEGIFAIDDVDLLTELDTLNTGAATVGADITEIKMVYVGEGQIALYTLARAAA